MPTPLFEKKKNDDVSYSLFSQLAFDFEPSSVGHNELTRSCWSRCNTPGMTPPVKTNPRSGLLLLLLLLLLKIVGLHGKGRKSIVYFLELVPLCIKTTMARPDKTARVDLEAILISSYLTKQAPRNIHQIYLLMTTQTIDRLFCCCCFSSSSCFCFFL